MSEQHLDALMSEYTIQELLWGLSARCSREAEGLRRIGHHATAEELEKFAEIFGDICIPGVLP